MRAITTCRGRYRPTTSSQAALPHRRTLRSCPTATLLQAITPTRRHNTTVSILIVGPTDKAPRTPIHPRHPRLNGATVNLWAVSSRPMPVQMLQARRRPSTRLTPAAPASVRTATKVLPLLTLSPVNHLLSTATVEVRQAPRLPPVRALPSARTNGPLLPLLILPRLLLVPLWHLRRRHRLRLTQRRYANHPRFPKAISRPLLRSGCPAMTATLLRCSSRLLVFAAEVSKAVYDARCL